MTADDRWLMVTAAFNEASHLADLAASLTEQKTQILARSVVLGDGSTDGTAEAAESLPAMPFPVTVVRRLNDEGLLAAAAARFPGWCRKGVGTLPRNRA